MPRIQQDTYLNLFTDFGFKKVFGEEPSKHLLVDFLNTLLPPEHQIESLEYCKNEYAGRTEFDRRAIIDLSCIAKSGERFLIEVQKAKQNYFKDRSIYYSTFPISEQAEKGEWNYQLKHVYTIGILNFTFEEDRHNRDVVHHVQLKNQHNQVFYDKLTYIYVTLPLFNKPLQALSSNQDKWFYLLRHLHELDHIPEGFNSQALLDVFNIAAVAKLSPEGHAAYEESQKVLRDLSNVINTAWDDGKAEGLAEGALLGEERAKLNIARNMLALVSDDAVIAAATGLTVEQVKALRAAQ